MTVQITVTLDDDAQLAQLKRQAARWAEGLRKASGVRIAQPVSAYLRHLIEQDRRRSRRHDPR